MAERRKFNLKIDNSGAALVTVIIVIAFISVIVTIMLYMSGVNYHMKATDKETKDSFYEAETALENIRSELMLQSKLAYQTAIQTVTEEYINFSGINREGDRKKVYYKAFEDAIKANYFSDANMTNPIDLEAFLQDKSKYSTNVTTSKDAPTWGNPEDGYILIEDVSVSYVKDGFYTKITTDLKIQAPEIDMELDTAQTTWVSTNVVEGFSRENYTMADCVIYLNWKKE